MYIYKAVAIASLMLCEAVDEQGARLKKEATQSHIFEQADSAGLLQSKRDTNLGKDTDFLKITKAINKRQTQSYPSITNDKYDFRNVYNRHELVAFRH
uniref:RxLR effector protein n=1 Tax=Rhabditophanes sp. KR3021 TaxID=114890 RepID=A0AC35TGS1_9BILA